MLLSKKKRRSIFRKSSFGKRTRNQQFESLESRQLLAADVVLNEFMASNATALELNGKTPDWIELHNRGDEEANLEGWKLKDRGAEWVFPAIAIGAGEFLMVYADGSDQVIYEPELEIHTNFKLKAGGEFLGLIRADGSIATEYNPYPDQVTDGSYGLSLGDSFPQYFPAPTPGAENPAAPNVIITEFMASNQSTLTDEDGDYADWIELHNASDVAANLNGWQLRDDDFRWEFPDVVIGPREFLVVFASANDRAEIEGTLHTNFKLAGRGDELQLRRSDGTVVSDFDFPKQREDVSYGLSVDLLETTYFENPTPGLPNITSYDGVRFSQPSGFYYYQPSMLLTLNTEVENSTIRYTMDGSEPTETNGNDYAEPILISNPTTIRAAAFSEEGRSVVDSRTYLLTNGLDTQSGDGLPQTWGSIADYDMDRQIVNDLGSIASQWGELPTVSLAINPDDLFSIDNGLFANPMLEGSQWERPVSFQYLGGDNNANASFTGNAFLKTAGRAEERNPANTSKISMEVNFAQPVIPGDVGVNLFEESEADEHSSFLLRAGFADSWLSGVDNQRNEAAYMRSTFITETQRAMGQPALSARPVNVFINGLYWGIYSLTENPNPQWFAESLGGRPRNYEVVDGTGVTAGNGTAWAELNERARQDLSQPDAYAAVAELVDIENLIDYIAIKRYAQISDGVEDSWFAAKDIRSDNGFQFFFLQNEESLGQVAANPSVQFDGPEFLFQQLIANEEFLQKFADRVQLHLSPGGALSLDATAARWTTLANELWQSYVLESARWGDFHRDGHPAASSQTLYTSNHAVTAINSGRTILEERSRDLISELQADELFPQVTAPVFNQHGGSTDSPIRILSDAGEIYYTTDGTDPLGTNGEPTENSRLYRSSIPISESTLVKARVVDGGVWSPVNQAIFYLGVPPQLQVTEFMYHPALEGESLFDDDDFEFIELTNVGNETIRVENFEFTDGISFSFADGAIKNVAPGEQILVVKNQEAFLSRYDTQGLRIAGEYEGQLNNGGEWIRLEDSLGQVIQQFEYIDFQHPLADGEGYSLVSTAKEFLTYQWQWEVSSFKDGTPGKQESLLPNGAIVINEMLADPADGQTAWIELQNQSGQAIDISGWFLSDEADTRRKFRIPSNTILGPDEFVVYHQDSDFGNAENPNTLAAFQLTKDDNSIRLVSANSEGEIGGYREVAELVPTPQQGFSIGRYAKSDGSVEYVSLSNGTPGAENVDPAVGPIVINEVMHSPVGGAEYIELLNITDTPLSLQSWEIDEGVKFQFPEDATIGANGFVVIAKSDPEIFRERNQLPDDLTIFGPYRGALRNEGEEVTLVAPTGNGEDAIVVDRVVYGSSAPWPFLSLEQGSSLERRSANVYGNDVDNWKPSLLGGTVGTTNIGVDDSPRDIPLTESFEQVNLDQIKGFSLTSQNGHWYLDGSNLISVSGWCDICPTDSTTNTAVLALNLQDSEQLALDVGFEYIHADDFAISVSNDRTNWYSAVDAIPIWNNRRTVVSVDIANAFEANNLPLTGSGYVRLQHRTGNLAFSGLSVTPNKDIDGPWIVDHQANITDGGIDVHLTFDEPMNRASLQNQGISMRTPAGEIVHPQTVESIDEINWVATFASQTIAGSYAISVSNGVNDINGNRLNPDLVAIDNAAVNSRPFEFEFFNHTSSTISFPYEADFNVQSLNELEGWEFSTGHFGSQWSISRNGTHLRMNGAGSANVHFDLSTAASPEDVGLALELTGRQSRTSLFLSEDGENWKTLANVYEPRGQISVDLGANALDLGFDLNQPLILRIERDSGDLRIRSLRVTDGDIFGPTGLPPAVIDEPAERVSSFEVEFNEPIDASTFSTSDVDIFSPTGIRVRADNITQLNDRSFRVDFAEQTSAGRYRYTVGPSIEDVFGNSMNQNQNVVGGETSDQLIGYFDVALTPTVYPVLTKFEPDEPIAGWAFSSINGSWASDRIGQDHFLVGERGDGSSRTRLDAVLAVDLSSQVDAERISLSFESFVHPGTDGSVYVSQDGEKWNWVSSIYQDRNWRQDDVTNMLDLKAALNKNDISLESEVYIQFRFQTNSWPQFRLDDVRISDQETEGPRVIDQTEFQQDGELLRTTITFDRAIDISSFGRNDATMKLHATEVRPREISAIDDRTFELVFDRPNTAGIFDFRIGPQILGTNGLPMNQTKDTASGTFDDIYTGSYFVPLDPVSLPYTQELTSPSLLDLDGWMFQTVNESGTREGGEWHVNGEREPFGDYHLYTLQYADCWSQHDGVLAVDLTDYETADDLILEFYFKRDTTSERKSEGGGRNMSQILVGNDVRTSRQIGDTDYLLNDEVATTFSDLNSDGILDLTPKLGEYTFYQFDLDRVLDDYGVSRSDTVYINFHRLAFYSSDLQMWDNIRIYSESDDNGIRQVGDSNLDGKFDSSDLVAVFSAGEYEDGIDGNSEWAEGDWNNDGDFDSSDLVLAFQSGNYVAAATRTAADFDSPKLSTDDIDAILDDDLEGILEDDLNL